MTLLQTPKSACLGHIGFPSGRLVETSGPFGHEVLRQARIGSIYGHKGIEPSCACNVYTIAILCPVDEIRSDEPSEEDPTDEEVDEALRDPNRLATDFYVAGETQWLILGETLAGRLLLVVRFEKNGIQRHITASAACPDELEHYRTSNEQRER